MSRRFVAPGKIILSGEYAVVFGYAGIAVPSSRGMEVVFEEDPALKDIEIRCEGLRGDELRSYAEKVVAHCRERSHGGRLVIHARLPLGKGLGSSTALVVAISRALLSDHAHEGALHIEDILNPGHSGLDFTTIWEGAPVLFRKRDDPKPFKLPGWVLQEAILIDTGLPSESTTELVAWMRSREAEIQEPLKTIGSCTDRIVQGEPLDLVMRDHHKAQVALGVVPSDVQELIAAIEHIGGAAKVIGAGSRGGGAGMVLALGDKKKNRDMADRKGVSTMAL